MEHFQTAALPKAGFLWSLPCDYSLTRVGKTRPCVLCSLDNKGVELVSYVWEQHVKALVQGSFSFGKFKERKRKNYIIFLLLHYPLKKQAKNVSLTYLYLIVL